MTRPTVIVAAALLALAASPARAQAPAEQYAVFETSRGKIGVKLLPNEAPKTVENFVGLATGTKEWTDPATGQKKKAPLYDGQVFHRVIPSFMIQGGDPLTKGAQLGQTRTPDGRPFGTGDPGYRFDDELPKAGTKVLFDKPCVLAMANAGPNTNGSQFFITEGFGAQVPQLEPRACDSKSGVCGYTRFGQGVCGCELVGQIARAGNSQTRIDRISIVNKAPTCK